MAKVIMMIGLPGSGKSTYAKNLTDYVRVSSDDIREELFGDASIQSDPKAVFDIFYKRAIDLLKSGKNVVLDSTAIHKKDRVKGIKRIAPYADSIEAWVIATPIEVVLERNAGRARVVPEDVIMRMYQSFRLPEQEEGFDKITVVRDGFDTYYGDPFEYVETLLDYEQHNKYHSMPLGKHIHKTVTGIFDLLRNIEPGTLDAVQLAFAGLLHDCAKPDVKSVDEEGYYHFYGHEYASGYKSLMFDMKRYGVGKKEVDEQCYELALLIQHHMDRFRHLKQPSFSNERLSMELDILMQADRAAH